MPAPGLPRRPARAVPASARGRPGKGHPAARTWRRRGPPNRASMPVTSR